jgi:hypothetical protein
MINWRSTTTHHGPRLALGLTGDEYILLDWIYHTQGSDKYGHDGWCEIAYKDIASLIGVSKGGAFQMVDRMEKRGFIEVNPANTKRKRVTSKFSLPVYFDISQDEEVGATIVQKVNAGIASVQKVNDESSESERKRSESERQRKVNKENIEVNNSLSPAKKIEERIEPVPMPEHIWGQGSETRLEKAQAALNEYIEENPHRPGEIANTARNVCDAEQFRDELDQWIRRNADDWAITQNPVKALTSGRSNFVSWLAQPWCREKYQKLQLQNQSHDSTNQITGNGRVQQRGKAAAILTTDERRRKYGLL